jgi:hypothetical protein
MKRALKGTNSKWMYKEWGNIFDTEPSAWDRVTNPPPKPNPKPNPKL